MNNTCILELPNGGRYPFVVDEITTAPHDYTCVKGHVIDSHHIFERSKEMNEAFVNYCRADVEATKLMLNKIYGAGAYQKSLAIKKVIFNNPATIVFWKDGTKTVVKCREGDTFDPEKGLAMAISKKVLGNNYDYFDKFKKWLPKEKNKKREPIGKVTNAAIGDSGLKLRVAIERAGKTINDGLNDGMSAAEAAVKEVHRYETQDLEDFTYKAIFEDFEFRFPELCLQKVDYRPYTPPFAKTHKPDTIIIYTEKGHNNLVYNYRDKAITLFDQE